MPKLSEQLSELYQGLTKSLNDFHHKRFNIEALKTVNHLANNTLAFANQHPDPFFAQLHLPKKRYTFRVNVTFNCLCLTLLLGKRLKWNESSLQQLLCAAITSFSHRQVLLEKAYTKKERVSVTQLNQPDSRLLKFTQQAKQDLWRSGAAIGNHVHNKNDRNGLSSLSYLPIENQILFIARWLSLRLTPNTRFPKQAFPDLIMQLIQLMPSACHSLISPLLSYPSLYAPGTLVKASNGTLYWVLSVSSDDLIAKQYDLILKKVTNKAEIVLKQGLKKTFSPKVIADLEEIEVLWDEEWKSVYDAYRRPMTAFLPSYKVSKPPAILMAIQDQLGKREVDLSRVCQLIERESAFVECLRITASHSSRQKLPIQETKHAVMLHGFGRTQSILTQQALTLRLTQHNFPIQALLNQITTLTKSFSEHIADNVPSILPQEASTFISFVCASLFTDAQYKRMVHTSNTTNESLSSLIHPLKISSF